MYIFKETTVTGVYITMFIKWVTSCADMHERNLTRLQRGRVLLFPFLPAAILPGGIGLLRRSLWGVSSSHARQPNTREFHLCERLYKLLTTCDLTLHIQGQLISITGRYRVRVLLPLTQK